MPPKLVVIMIVSAVGLFVAILLFLKNQKDRKEMERRMNQDYPRPHDAEHNRDADDLKAD